MVENVRKFSSHCPSFFFGTRKEKKPKKVEENNFHIYKTHFSFLFYLDPSYFQSSKLSHFFSFKMI
jgi:hypothetical protein